MDSKLFLKVWDCADIRKLIISFMYPYQESSTYYEYIDGIAAIKQQYTKLLNEKHMCMYFDTQDDDVQVLDIAIARANPDIITAIIAIGYTLFDIESLMAVDEFYRLRVLKLLIDRGLVKYKTNAKHNEISMIIAAQNGDLDMLLDLYVYRKKTLCEVFEAAIEYGQLSVVSWLFSVCEMSTDCVFEIAARNGQKHIYDWLIDNNYCYKGKINNLIMFVIHGGNYDLFCATYDESIITLGDAYYSAIEHCRIDIIKHLYNLGARYIYDYSRIWKQIISGKSIECVRYFCGMKIELPIGAFIRAIKSGNADIIMILYDTYRDAIQTKLMTEFVGSATYNKIIKNGHLHILKLLYPYINNRTYLLSALIYILPQYINIAILSWAAIYLDIPTHKENDIFDIAIKYNCSDIVEHLMVKFKVDEAYKTNILHRAIRHGKTKLAEFMYSQMQKPITEPKRLMRELICSGNTRAIKWLYSKTPGEFKLYKYIPYVICKELNTGILVWIHTHISIDPFWIYLAIGTDNYDAMVILYRLLYSLSLCDAQDKASKKLGEYDICD